MRFELARRPFRRVGTQADFAQHHEADQHFLVAAAKQRDQRADQRTRGKQRKQRRDVFRDQARGEEFRQAPAVAGHR